MEQPSRQYPPTLTGLTSERKGTGRLFDWTAAVWTRERWAPIDRSRFPSSRSVWTRNGERVLSPLFGSLNCSVSKRTILTRSSVRQPKLPTRGRSCERIAGGPIHHHDAGFLICLTRCVGAVGAPGRIPGDNDSTTVSARVGDVVDFHAAQGITSR